MAIDLDIADYVAVLSESLSGVALGAYNGDLDIFRVLEMQGTKYFLRKTFSGGEETKIDELEYGRLKSRRHFTYLTSAVRDWDRRQRS